MSRRPLHLPGIPPSPAMNRFQEMPRARKSRFPRNDFSGDPILWLQEYRGDVLTARSPLDVPRRSRTFSWHPSVSKYLALGYTQYQVTFSWNGFLATRFYGSRIIAAGDVLTSGSPLDVSRRLRLFPGIHPSPGTYRFQEMRRATKSRFFFLLE